MQPECMLPSVYLRHTQVAMKDKQWQVGAKDTSKESEAAAKDAEAAARKAAAAAQAAAEEGTFKGKSIERKLGGGKVEKGPTKSDKKARAELAAKALAAAQAGPPKTKKAPKADAAASKEAAGAEAAGVTAALGPPRTGSDWQQ